MGCIPIIDYNTTSYMYYSGRNSIPVSSLSRGSATRDLIATTTPTSSDTTAVLPPPLQRPELSAPRSILHMNGSDFSRAMGPAAAPGVAAGFTKDHHQGPVHTPSDRQTLHVSSSSHNHSAPEAASTLSRQPPRHTFSDARAGSSREVLSAALGDAASFSRVFRSKPEVLQDGTILGIFTFSECLWLCGYFSARAGITNSFSWDHLTGAFNEQFSVQKSREELQECCLRYQSYFEEEYEEVGPKVPRRSVTAAPRRKERGKASRATGGMASGDGHGLMQGVELIDLTYWSMSEHGEQNAEPEGDQRPGRNNPSLVNDTSPDIPSLPRHDPIPADGPRRTRGQNQRQAATAGNDATTNPHTSPHLFGKTYTPAQINWLHNYMDNYGSKMALKDWVPAATLFNTAFRQNRTPKALHECVSRGAASAARPPVRRPELYTKEHIKWLREYMSTHPIGTGLNAWIPAAVLFNSTFGQNRSAHALYECAKRNIGPVAQKQKQKQKQKQQQQQKQTAQRTAVNRVYTAEELAWLETNIPVLVNMGGQAQWRDVEGRFKNYFGITRSAASLRMQWWRVTKGARRGGRGERGNGGEGDNEDLMEVENGDLAEVGMQEPNNGASGRRALGGGGPTTRGYNSGDMAPESTPAMPGPNAGKPARASGRNNHQPAPAMLGLGAGKPLTPSQTSWLHDYTRRHPIRKGKRDWIPIVDIFNTVFHENRTANALYKWGMRNGTPIVAELPSPSSSASSPAAVLQSRSSHAFTEEEVQWMLANVPRYCSGGKPDWGSVRERFVSELGGVRSAGALRTQWWRLGRGGRRR